MIAEFRITKNDGGLYDMIIGKIGGLPTLMSCFGRGDKSNP